MLFGIVVRQAFAKMKASEILSSTYQELASMIANQYGKQEFKNQNAVCLHQIQQQHKVISPGDWVLDIGAAPHFEWTKLALKLSSSANEQNRVISNDLIDSNVTLDRAAYVKGDFLQEQVRTNIALKLNTRKFNTILVDSSPQFTGEIDKDGLQISKVIIEALNFSSTFLEKGGNFICKVLHCSSTDLIQENGKLFFNEFFQFRPSIIRQKSPVKFLVMKGFGMNHQLQAMEQLISRYRGSSKNKQEVVKSYIGKYSWNPVDVIINKAKNDILKFHLQGRAEAQIVKIFLGDPFIKVKEILKQIKMIDRAYSQNDNIQLQKAINKFSNGRLFKQSLEVPTTRQDWINFLEKMQNQDKQNMKKMKKTKEKTKPKQNLEPLAENQIYMKSNLTANDEEKEFIYIKGDLLGNYNQAFENQYIQSQIAKFAALKGEDNESVAKGWQKLMEDVQTQNAEDEKGGQANLEQLGSLLKNMNDEDFKQKMDKQGYEDEIEQIWKKTNKGSRNKFSNK